MENQVVITNIQRFSLHDGPGIRTTVFMKGCSLHCPWCSNPENIGFSIEPFVDNGKKSCFGQKVTLSHIYREIVKDRLFYKPNGGVTFSGGEPLLFVDKLEPLFKKLKDECISLCAETSFFVLPECIQKAVDYFDYFYIDIKIMDSQKCKFFLNGDLDLYKKNVRYVLKTKKKVFFRVPLICGYTTEYDNINKVADFCEENDISSIELIVGHNLAEKKYKILHKDMLRVPEMDALMLIEIQNIFNKKNISCEICRI